MDANPDTWREGMKNWREFKIFGVRVMDTRNGRTHLREPQKWPFVGALICWPIALGLSQVAIMAIRARDLSETLAAITGAAVSGSCCRCTPSGWEGPART